MTVIAENVGALGKEMAVNMPEEDVANEATMDSTGDRPVGGEYESWYFEFVPTAGPGIFHFFLAWVGVILSVLWIILSSDDTTVSRNMWTTHFANDCFISYLDHGMMTGDISSHSSFELDMFVLLMALIRWNYFFLTVGLLWELKSKRKTLLKMWAVGMFIFLTTVWTALLILPLFKEMSKDRTLCLVILQFFMTVLWIVMSFLIRKMGDKRVVDLTIA